MIVQTEFILLVGLGGSGVIARVELGSVRTC